MEVLNQVLDFLTQSRDHLLLIWTILVIVAVLITSAIKFVMAKAVKNFEAKKYEYLFLGIATIFSFGLVFGFNYVHAGLPLVSGVLASASASLMASSCYKFFCQPPRLIVEKVKNAYSKIKKKVKDGKLPVKEIVDGIKDLMNDNGSASENASTIDVVEAYKQKKAELEQKNDERNVG